MPLVFRNIDVEPSEPVANWGVEGLLAAIERGHAPDWERIAGALDTDTNGAVADALDQALGCARPSGQVALFRALLARSKRQ